MAAHLRVLPLSRAAVTHAKPETVEVTLDNLSFLAYRRVSTTIELPGVGAGSARRQVVTIDPLELDAALKRDGSGKVEGSRQITNEVV